MRLNENTVIFGDRVLLVPYRAEHVPTYHEWMKSPELLELTASEPLSFEEELEMQRKWHLDEDKLTFILLARPEICSSPNKSMTPEEIRRCKMIGDVNLFLPDGLAGQGECEIMIASKDDRRKGYAVEALQLFLRHLAQHLPLDPLQLIVKIASANIPSIKLFQTLGFGIVKHVKVFDEVEMHYAKPDDADILADLNLDSKRPARDGPKAIWEEIDLQGRIGMYYP